MSVDTTGLLPPEPSRGLAVWLGDDEDEQISQLLCLGLWLSGRMEGDDEAAEQARLLGVPVVRTAGKTARSRPLPWLADRALQRVEPRRHDGGEVVFVVDSDQLARTRVDSSGEGNEGSPASTADLETLWRNMTGWRSARSAVAFVSLALHGRRPAVRAMAAAVLTGVRTENDDEVERVRTELRDAEGYAAVFARMAGVHASGQEVPDDLDAADESADGADDADVHGLTDGETDAAEEATATSIVVHGTFARLIPVPARWYAPSAALPARIRRGCTPSLYRRGDYFRWTGAYRAVARAEGAADLLEWCRLRGIAELDTVFAHSHGGSIVLEAIAQGLRVKLLVLLHTPVIPRPDSEWRDMRTRVGRIVELRTPLDWVVHLDRLFTNARNAMPPAMSAISRTLTPAVTGSLRFSHTRYVEDDVWKSLGLTNDIAFERTYV
ncbi:hypothetical protein [Microbacterium sp. K35]|uniref:hypothetical protein n=1 Tax=Microbacterium sp. K35 TaxID=2305440 RepID=UPI00109B7253|nr:hypothetical protein [Microbacterium sp. K35]